MEYQQKVEKGHQFLALSLVFAILSFTTIQFVILPPIFGGLSILFAILGRGSNEKIPDKGKVSIAISSISIVLTFIITVFAVKMVFTDPAMRQQLNDTSMELYGVTFDDAFEESFGVELPPAKNSN